MIGFVKQIVHYIALQVCIALEEQAENPDFDEDIAGWISPKPAFHEVESGTILSGGYNIHIGRDLPDTFPEWWCE